MQDQRQFGNYISVRQKPDQDGGWGTLRKPKDFQVSFLEPLRLKSRLGYEAVPASEFWRFRVDTAVSLQVDRISDDRYSNHVGVALLDGNQRRVAPLVQSASGYGDVVNIPAGTYIIVASLGVPVSIRELALQVTAVPAAAALQMVAVLASGWGGGLMLAAGSPGGLLAFAGAMAFGEVGGDAALLQMAEPSPQIMTAGSAILVEAPQLCSDSVGGVTALGAVHDGSAQFLDAMGRVGPFVGSASLAPVVWIHAPYESWQCRHVSGVVELNSEYVSFSDPAQLSPLLALLGDILSGQ